MASSSSSFSPIRISVNKFQNFKLSFIRNYYHQSSVIRPKNLNEISLRNLRRQYYSREKNFNGWTVTSDLKFVSFGSHMIFFMMLPTVVHYYTSNSRVNVIRDDDLSLLANTDEDGINSNRNQNTYKPLNYKIDTRIDDNLVTYLKDNRKNELTSSNISNNSSSSSNNNNSSETLIKNENFEINNDKDGVNSFNSKDNDNTSLSASLPMTPMELEELIDIPLYRTKPQRSLNRTHTLPDRLIQVYMVDEIMKNTVNKDDKLSNSIKTKLNKSGLTDCKSFISIKKATNEINKNNNSNEIDRLRFIHNDNDFQPIVSGENYNFTESINEINNYYKLVNENKITKTEYILFISKKLNDFNLLNEINFKNLSLKNNNNNTNLNNKKFNKEFNTLYKKLFIQLNSLKFYSLAQYVFRSFTVTRQNTLNYLNPVNNSVKDKEIIKLTKLKSKIGKRFENSKTFKPNRSHNNNNIHNNQLNNLQNRVNSITNYSKNEIKQNKNLQLNKTSENSRLLIHSNYLIKPDPELFDEILEHTIVIKALSAFNQLLRLLGVTVKTSDFNYNNEINNDNLSNEIYKVRSLIFNKSVKETNQKYLNSLIIALKGCYEFGKINEANEIIEKLINYSLVNNSYSNVNSNTNPSNNFSHEKLNEIKEILPNIILAKILKSKNMGSSNNDLIINWANQLSSICC